MQLTIADVNTTRTYHFEANEKDHSPNTEHLGFDTSQMAAIPKIHFDFPECDVAWQRPISLLIAGELLNNCNKIEVRSLPHNKHI